MVIGQVERSRKIRSRICSFAVFASAHTPEIFSYCLQTAVQWEQGEGRGGGGRKKRMRNGLTQFLKPDT